MPQTKVSDIVALFLKQKEIEVIFGVIGSANSHIFDSIDKLGYTKIINVHHEQAAVMAMGAYYRSSGKLAAALATAGPGMVNTVTGVMSCWADSVPGILLGGQEATHHLSQHRKLRMLGTQGFDAVKMLQDITKSSSVVLDPDETQDILEEAYNSVYDGRPGPAYVDLPFDVQSKATTLRPWQTFPTVCGAEINNEDIDDIISSLKEASRPVIIAGQGIKLAGAEEIFKKLLKNWKIPTLLSWGAIDLLADDHPQFYGRSGIYGQRAANFILQNSDFVLVLGSRLALPQVGYDINDFAPGAAMIAVDIDEGELEKYAHRLERGIAADVGDVLSSLSKLKSQYDGPPMEWTSRCNDWVDRYPQVMPEHYEKSSQYVNSYRFIDRLSAHLQNNHVIVTDMGTALLSGHQAIRIKDQQKMFTSTGLGEMGYGIPAAIGAAFSDLSRPVLCLNCDGGMMMNLQELQTIVHYRLPIKIIIFNNDGYLMIKQTQKLLFKGEFTSSDENSGVSLPDYDKLGKAFGYETFSIRNWEEVDPVLGSFLSSDGAAICQVYMDPVQDFAPKVKPTVTDDGGIIPSSLDDMSPLLDLDILKSEMGELINKKSIDARRIINGSGSV